MDKEEVIERVIFAGHLNCWHDKEMVNNILLMLKTQGYIIIKQSTLIGLTKNVSELLTGLNNSFGGINVQSNIQNIKE